jgi:DUF1365 family protein
MHARFHPRTHRFAYRLFYLSLDLDELPGLGQRLRLLRIDRPGLLSFRQADYLPAHQPVHNPSEAPPANSGPPPPASLKSRLLEWLAQHGVAAPADSRVTLVTLPRVLGYQFNPVSFYFVHGPGGEPLAAVAEVTNTFRETKLFLLGPETLRPDGPQGPEFRLRAPKHFYVSPFSDVDVAFDFRLRPPGPRLVFQIDDHENGRRTLTSTVTNRGAPRPISDRRLAWFSLKYPLITLKVIAAIHWEALRLWIKRVPWFAKSARSADQRDLHRPHRSIASPPAASSVPPLPPLPSHRPSLPS